jgi:ankyrin repeat protein
MDCLEMVANYFGFSVRAKIDAWEYRQLKDAVITENLQSVKDMISSGYNYYDGSETILHYSIRNLKKDIFTELLALLREPLGRRQVLPSLLLEAIFVNKIEMVVELLYEGVDVNARIEGTTPVIAAAANGALEILKHLIEKGADPLATNDERQTALHRACFYG